MKETTDGPSTLSSRAWNRLRPKLAHCASPPSKFQPSGLGARLRNTMRVSRPQSFRYDSARLLPYDDMQPHLDGDCGRTSEGCAVRGEPLFWPDLCVTFGVHADGSTLRAISYERAEEAARAAFREWISADCGDSTPSIGVVPYGKVYCDTPEFNHDGADSGNASGPNANVIMFRDDGWPYNDTNNILALTTVTFLTKTGEILDADIEINSTRMALSTSTTHVTSDLQSILTHEFGHFLGLAHTRVADATMYADYDSGDLSFRTIAEDDAAGVCSIYPGTPEPIEDCRGEAPRYGFSRYCGTADIADAGVLCSVPRQAQNTTNDTVLWVCLVACTAIFCTRRRWA